MLNCRSTRGSPSSGSRLRAVSTTAIGRTLAIAVSRWRRTRIFPLACGGDGLRTAGYDRARSHGGACRIVKTGGGAAEAAAGLSQAARLQPDRLIQMVAAGGFEPPTKGL